MLNKQIFEIETGQLLAKNPSEKWVGLQSLKTLDFAPVSSKEFLHIQATIECGFTLKCICGMIRTYSHTSLVVTVLRGFLLVSVFVIVVCFVCLFVFLS